MQRQLLILIALLGACGSPQPTRTSDGPPATESTGPADGADDAQTPPDEQSPADSEQPAAAAVPAPTAKADIIDLKSADSIARSEPLTQAEELGISRKAPIELAASSSHLFFSSAGGRLYRMKRTGGKARVIGRSRDSAVSVIVDDTHVYWSDLGREVIWRARLNGGKQKRVVRSEYPGTLAVDATHVYIAGGGGTLAKARKSGGKRVELAGVQVPNTGFLEIAVDDTHVYWGVSGPGMVAPKGTGKLLRIAKEGGTPEVVADNLDGPRGLVIDADHVYFGTGETIVARVPKSGGEVQKVYVGDPNPQVTAIDETYVYWFGFDAMDDYSGYVRRAPRAGGPAETVVIRVPNPTGLVLSGNRLYWVAVMTNKIMTAEIPLSSGESRQD